MGYYLKPESAGLHKLPVFTDAVDAGKIIEVDRAEAAKHRTQAPRDVFLIAIVDNGPYDAVGVAVDQQDVATFTADRDMRPVRYFICPRHWLMEIQPDFKL